MTIRTILSKLSDCVDFNEANYVFVSVPLLFADGQKRDFAAFNDNDKRDVMYVVLGKGYSTFKHGHIKTVYCVLPKEAATSEIEQYRNMQDPYMYKYRLPERVFNSILNQFLVDIDSTVEACRNHYAQTGYEWDGDANWRRKLQEWFGWKFD